LRRPSGDLKLKHAFLEQVRLVHFKPGNIEINPLPQAPREARAGSHAQAQGVDRARVDRGGERRKGAEPLACSAARKRLARSRRSASILQVKEVMQHFPDARIAAVRPTPQPEARTQPHPTNLGRAQRGRNYAMKNFGQMMKQAQELQGRMAEMQAEMERTRIEGRSGGGMVVVTLTGKGDMAGVKIDPSLFKPEESEILEDLIVAAHNDAKNKVEEAMKEKMKSLTGGLPLPPGLKLF
jgi:DNA-binding YbaB/EbfC family protein